MLPIQVYSAALLCTDAYELFRLWSASPRTLANGSCWFDAGANAPLAVVLYTGLVMCLMLPRFFVIAEPVNRWVLMLEAIHNGLRVLLYSFLFMKNEQASQANTMLLTFMLWNTFVYGRTYYTTMMMLREHSK